MLKLQFTFIALISASILLAQNNDSILKAVAGEAARDVQIAHVRNRPDERVVIDDVHLVVAGPGARRAKRRQARHARGERGPDHFVEEAVVDGVERRVVDIRAARRRTGDKGASLGAEPDAAGVDDERAAGQLRRRLEHEHVALSCAHRQRDAQRREQWRRPRAGGDDDGIGIDARRVIRQHAGDAVVLREDAARTRVHEACAASDRRAAEVLQQAPAVEPAFAFEAERGERDAICGDPVEPFAQGRGIEQRDVDFALGVAQKAVAASGEKDGTILDTLARCYWEKGDKAKAIETQKRAVELAKGGPMEGQLQQTLDGYVKGEAK